MKTENTTEIKRTKKSTKILATLALVTTIGFVSIQAKDFNNNSEGFCKSRMGMMNHHKDKRHQIKVIMEQLNLTDEQKITLKSLRPEKRNHRQVRNHRRDKGYDMASFISVDGVDRRAIMKFNIDKMEKRVNARADQMEKMLAVLTPEQRTKFVSLFKFASLLKAERK